MSRRTRRIQALNEDEMVTLALTMSQYEAESRNEKDLQDIPCISPSDEELMNPLLFMERHWALGEQYGAIKLKMPDYWTKATYLDENLLRFKVRFQNLKNMMTVNGFMFPPEIWSMSDMRDIDEQFRTRLHHACGPNFEEVDMAYNADRIEALYWQLVTSSQEDHMAVYAADLPTSELGSGFPMENPPRGAYSAAVAPANESELKFARHPFNLNNLAKARGSLLANSSEHVPGVTSPWLYIGGPLSAFCWHTEDSHLASANYQHWGSGKIWYIVPPAYADQVQETISLQLTARAHGDQKKVERDLKSLRVMTRPGLLAGAGIPVFRTVQRPGEMVLLWPRAYHAGINTGLNCNEACNVAPPSWVMQGVEAHKKTRVLKNEVVHVETLLAKEACRRACIKKCEDVVATHPEILLPPSQSPVEKGIPREADVTAALRTVMLSLFQNEAEVRSLWLRKGQALVEARIAPERMRTLRKLIELSRLRTEAHRHLQTQTSGFSPRDIAHAAHASINKTTHADRTEEAVRRSQLMHIVENAPLAIKLLTSLVLSDSDIQAEARPAARERRQKALELDTLCRVASKLCPMTEDIEGLVWPPVDSQLEIETVLRAREDLRVRRDAPATHRHLLNLPHAPTSLLSHQNPPVSFTDTRGPFDEADIRRLVHVGSNNMLEEPEIITEPSLGLTRLVGFAGSLRGSALSDMTEVVANCGTPKEWQDGSCAECGCSEHTHFDRTPNQSWINPAFARAGVLNAPAKDCDTCHTSTVLHFVSCIHENSRFCCYGCQRHHRCILSPNVACSMARMVVRVRMAHIAAWCEALGVELTPAQKHEAARLDWSLFKTSRQDVLCELPQASNASALLALGHGGGSAEHFQLSGPINIESVPPPASAAAAPTATTTSPAASAANATKKGSKGVQAREATSISEVLRS